MRTFSCLLLSTLLLGFSGCVQVEREPLPLAAGGSRGASVAGTRADAVGLRDDVHAHVQAAYAGAATRAAVTRLAKGFQALLVNTSGKAGALAAAATLNAAIDCLYALDSI